MNTYEEYIRTREILFDAERIRPQSKTAHISCIPEYVHYLELGNGRPLILIHGGGSHSSEWMTILKLLSSRFHLYVVDRPGCGLTSGIDYGEVPVRDHAVDFLGGFMDAVGLNKALFMANSMGGYFSICFALQHPDRVEKLLLIGAPAGLSLRVPLMLRLIGIKGLNKFLVHTIARPSVQNVRRIYKQLLVADVTKLSAIYLEHCYYSLLLPDAEKGFLSLLENVLTLDGWRKDLYIGDQLQHLAIPVSFLWGDKDAFEKPEKGRQMTLVIKDHKFEVVGNAGHCPWLDQPERCGHLAICMLED